MIHIIIEICYLLVELILCLIPRFITEDVAMEYNPEYDTFDPIIPLSQVEEDEEYDGWATINSFTWLGIAWPLSKEATIHPWGEE